MASLHQHLSAVVKMQAGDDGVRPEEACYSIITDIAGRGETASNEGILTTSLQNYTRGHTLQNRGPGAAVPGSGPVAAANAQQHTGMQHLAAPLQENGAGWPF